MQEFWWLKRGFIARVATLKNGNRRGQFVPKINPRVIGRLSFLCYVKVFVAKNGVE
jgi:hypothetical protein